MQKQIMDQAYSIMVVLVWKTHDGFWALREMALDWWDIPADQPVFQEYWGTIFGLFPSGSGKWCTSKGRTIWSQTYCPGGLLTTWLTLIILTP